MKINIRAYKKSDAPALLKIYRASDGSVDADLWERTFLCRATFVAQMGDIPVGFGDIDIDISCTACSSGTLCRLCVLPEHRRSGIGGALLFAIEEHAGKNAVGVISVYANKDSASFFFAAGYKLAGEEDGILILRKRIS